MTDERFLSPEGWPRGNGYAHGVTSRGRFVFVAGQVGWNPLTQKFETDDLVEQVAQALRNVVAVLRAAVAEPGHITRTIPEGFVKLKRWRDLRSSGG